MQGSGHLIHLSFLGIGRRGRTTENAYEVLRASGSNKLRIGQSLVEIPSRTAVLWSLEVGELEKVRNKGNVNSDMVVDKER